MKRTRTCCTRHCGNGCSLIVTEKDDGSVRITGDPDHPETRGFLCGKTARFMERLNAEDRILEPMIKENGSFRPAEWNEALDLVAGRINALRATPERMANVFYVASYGVLFRASPAFFGRLGATEVSGDYCLDGGIEALERDFGVVMQPMMEDVGNARAIVNWGRNLDAQSMLMGRAVTRARQRGARVLSITPGEPGYRAFSDHIITIRPGTDRFLALAAVKILRERGALATLARERAHGFEAFLALAGSHGLDALLGACGVSLADAELLADHYQRGPATTLFGRGLQRYAHGGENVRFIDALALCTGNVGIPGGGVHYCQGDLGHIRYDWHQRPAPAPRSLPFHRLGRAIMEADPPIEFFYIDGTNAVNQVPDAPALKKALERVFTVSVEAFWNDTALASDVVFPPALMLETEDLVRCSAHGYVHHSAKVFEPRGKCRSNFEIIAELARRLDPPMDFPSEEEVMRDALKARRMSTELEDIRERCYVPSPPYPLPFGGGVFAHPDGKARLVAELTPEPGAPGGYPLRLLSTVQKRHLLSQIPEREQVGPQPLFLSPRCALLQENGGGLDISRPCFLVTEHGRMPVSPRLLDSLHPEAAHVPRGGWMKTGWGLNALIGPLGGDMAGQCAYYSQWCTVENGGCGGC
jgi:anaerobic selenocysteine-containing dehydrogenase